MPNGVTTICKSGEEAYRSYADRFPSFRYRGMVRQLELMEFKFTGELVRYSMQLAMLLQLRNTDLISNEEFNKTKSRLMRDYNIISDFTA